MASFIGLFFRHRIWGILGFLVSMIPMVALVFWFGVHYEQLVADGYIGKENIVPESVAPQTDMARQTNDAVADAKPEKPKVTQPAPQPKTTTLPKSAASRPTKKQVDYIEIKGPKGYVNVYIGMPKDEVKALLGRADGVSVMTLGNETHETWTYRGSSYLRIEFVNGKLDTIY